MSNEQLLRDIISVLLEGHSRCKGWEWRQADEDIAHDAFDRLVDQHVSTTGAQWRKENDE